MFQTGTTVHIRLPSIADKTYHALNYYKANPRLRHLIKQRELQKASTSDASSQGEQEQFSVESTDRSDTESDPEIEEAEPGYASGTGDESDTPLPAPKRIKQDQIDGALNKETNLQDNWVVVEPITYIGNASAHLEGPCLDLMPTLKSPYHSNGAEENGFIPTREYGCDPFSKATAKTMCASSSRGWCRDLDRQLTDNVDLTDLKTESNLGRNTNFDDIAVQETFGPGAAPCATPSISGNLGGQTTFSNPSFGTMPPILSGQSYHPPMNMEYSMMAHQVPLASNNPYSHGLPHALGPNVFAVHDRRNNLCRLSTYAQDSMVDGADR